MNTEMNTEMNTNLQPVCTGLTLAGAHVIMLCLPPHVSQWSCSKVVFLFKKHFPYAASRCVPLLTVEQTVHFLMLSLPCFIALKVKCSMIHAKSKYLFINRYHRSTHSSIGELYQNPCFLLINALNGMSVVLHKIITCNEN